MSLDKTSQVIEISESPEHASVEVPEHIELPAGNDENIIVYEEKPSEEVVLELHDPDDMEVDFSLPKIPGAPNDEFIEVNEADVLQVDENDAKSKIEVKEAEPFDWKKRGGLVGFLAFLKERFNKVPPHDGKSIAGVERAINYLEKLDGCISEAMRSDLDGQLDISKIEDIRTQIEDGLNRLEERSEKLKGAKKSKTKKSKADIDENPLVKEAQKMPSIKGIMITVPLLISRIARTCINGSVSAGHDIEQLFNKQCEDYDLTKREQAEVLQLLADMGYAVRRDRLLQFGEKYDWTSSDNGDYAAGRSA